MHTRTSKERSQRQNISAQTVKKEGKKVASTFEERHQELKEKINAIRPKYDVIIVELVVNANERDAVRPKRDMDAEKSAENVNENDAVRRKRDMNAE